MLVCMLLEVNFIFWKCNDWIYNRGENSVSRKYNISWLNLYRTLVSHTGEQNLWNPAVSYEYLQHTSIGNSAGDSSETNAPSIWMPMQYALRRVKIVAPVGVSILQGIRTVLFRSCLPCRKREFSAESIKRSWFYSVRCSVCIHTTSLRPKITGFYYFLFQLRLRCRRGKWTNQLLKTTEMELSASSTSLARRVSMNSM